MRDGKSWGEEQPGGASVAVSETSPAEVVHLTRREIYLHRSGQAAGEAALYHSLAKHFGGLSAQYESAARARQKTAEQLLKAAASVNPGVVSRVGAWFKARFAGG